MSIRALSIVAGLLLVLPALSEIAAAQDEASKGPPAPALRILSSATRVECFRIDPRTDSKGDAKPDAKQIDGYPITDTAKEQDGEFAAKLAAAVKDEKSYGDPARCFFPGVGFRAWNDKTSVDVIICYECSNFYVVARDADGKKLNRPRTAGFQANWSAFVALAKAAFPDDPDIQKLDDTRGRKGSDGKPGL